MATKELSTRCYYNNVAGTQCLNVLEGFYVQGNLRIVPKESNGWLPQNVTDLVTGLFHGQFIDVRVGAKDYRVNLEDYMTLLKRRVSSELTHIGVLERDLDRLYETGRFKTDKSTRISDSVKQTTFRGNLPSEETKKLFKGIFDRSFNTVNEALLNGADVGRIVHVSVKEDGYQMYSLERSPSAHDFGDLYVAPRKFATLTLFLLCKILGVGEEITRVIQDAGASTSLAGKEFTYSSSCSYKYSIEDHDYRAEDAAYDTYDVYEAKEQFTKQQSIVYDIASGCLQRAPLPPETRTQELIRLNINESCPSAYLGNFGKLSLPGRV